MSTIRTKPVEGEGVSLFDFITATVVETAFYEMNFDDEQTRGLIDAVSCYDAEAVIQPTPLGLYIRSTKGGRTTRRRVGRYVRAALTAKDSRFRGWFSTAFATFTDEAIRRATEVIKTLADPKTGFFDVDFVTGEADIVAVYDDDAVKTCMTGRRAARLLAADGVALVTVRSNGRLLARALVNVRDRRFFKIYGVDPAVNALLAEYLQGQGYSRTKDVFVGVWFPAPEVRNESGRVLGYEAPFVDGMYRADLVKRNGQTFWLVVEDGAYDLRDIGNLIPVATHCDRCGEDIRFGSTFQVHDLVDREGRDVLDFVGDYCDTCTMEFTKLARYAGGHGENGLYYVISGHTVTVEGRGVLVATSEVNQSLVRYRNRWYHLDDCERCMTTGESVPLSHLTRVSRSRKLFALRDDVGPVVYRHGMAGDAARGCPVAAWHMWRQALPALAHDCAAVSAWMGRENFDAIRDMAAKVLCKIPPLATPADMAAAHATMVRCAGHEPEADLSTLPVNLNTLVGDLFLESKWHGVDPPTGVSSDDMGVTDYLVRWLIGRAEFHGSLERQVKLHEAEWKTELAGEAPLLGCYSVADDAWDDTALEEDKQAYLEVLGGQGDIG